MILYLFFVLLGLSIGSFLNAFLWRYENKKSLLGRSACPKCRKKIVWYDNIPLLSYILLRGRCRHCKKPISLQYPTVELLTALLFVAALYFSEPGKIINQWFRDIFSFQFSVSYQMLSLNILLLILIFVIFGCLILITVYDLKNKVIPNGFTLTFVITTIVYITISGIDRGNLFDTYLLSLLAGIVAFLFFFTFVYFSKETWMGGGDAKFAFGIGLLLGPANTFLTVLIASIVGSIYGISVLLIKKIKEEKKDTIISKGGLVRNSHEVPFGPFLALGTIISFLFGSQLISWYARIFLGL